MPTGYTDSLENGRKWDLHAWLKRDAVRALGVCIMLRDEGRDMTAEQIEEYLRSSARGDSNYYVQRLKESRAELKALNARTDKEWGAAWRAHMKEQAEERAKYVAKQKIRFSEYEKSIKTLEALKPKGEVSVGVIRFALEQLKMVASEYEYSGKFVDSLYSCHETWQDMKEKETKGLEDEIKYLEKARAEEIKREESRLEEYLEFVKEADGWKRAGLLDWKGAKK